MEAGGHQTIAALDSGEVGFGTDVEEFVKIDVADLGHGGGVPGFLLELEADGKPIPSGGAMADKQWPVRLPPMAWM